MDFPRGTSYRSVVEMLREFKGRSADPDRQLTGTYHLTGLTQVKRLAELALSQFLESNAIFREAERGVSEMESDVISMIGSLWGLGKKAKSSDPSLVVPGFMTSGGTESNFIALHAMRMHANRRRGRVVFPSTIHPTVWKASHVLGLDPVVVPVKEDFTADIDGIDRAVGRDAIGIVATCGTIPWSTIDPIREIGKIADERSVYLHVDAAWGGLICPWLRELGYEIPNFGFENKGVCSISADPHKQAFSIYPAGSIVFRDESFLRSSTWSATHAGRKYTSRGLLGSRPGSTVAATWALMHFLGRRILVDLSRRCMELTMGFVRKVERVTGLEIAAAPKMNMASVVSTRVDMERVKQKLRDRGWFFLEANGAPLTRLNALGVGIEPFHKRVLPRFLKDIREATRSVQV